MSLAQLTEWVQAHGGSLQNLLFQEIRPGYFGAVLDLSGSPTILVPTKVILKLSDAIKAMGPEFGEICRKTRGVNCVTKLFLAREMAPDRLKESFYRPYLELLPDSKTINSPYVWLPADQNKLKGTNLGSSLRENLSEIVEEWWLVVSLVPESLEKPQLHFVDMKFYYEHKFYKEEDLYEYVSNVEHEKWTSFPAYLWAAMIMKSRSFPSYLLKECMESLDEVDIIQPDVAMLIPLVDLLNHNPKAQVTWGGLEEKFVFEAKDVYSPGQEVFNNYGQKGNEELLLAYGFCIENNAADSVALKIKVPPELFPELESHGVQLPKLDDYTTSVVRLDSENAASPTDGLLFFVSRERVPENLVQVFQWLVRTRWEQTLTLRMQLSGLNHLRQALESKSKLIQANSSENSPNDATINIYLTGQKKILDSAAKKVKGMEKELLAQHKSQLLLLKSVYKRDIPFAQALLVTMGVTSYDDIISKQLLDQVWLLYLIRCFNRDQYTDNTSGEDESYLPEWVAESFARMDRETEISAAEVLQFREIYESLVLPMNQAVPEIFNKGKWTVRELIVSSKVLDTIGFVRGKEQECILVQPS